VDVVRCDQEYTFLVLYIDGGGDNDIRMIMKGDIEHWHPSEHRLLRKDHIRDIVVKRKLLPMFLMQPGIVQLKQE
jgi:hypothetical protein